MKIITILVMIIICQGNSFAYDGKIKDNYGNAIGYINLDDGKVKVYNVRGEQQYQVEPDDSFYNESEIKDEYGNRVGSFDLFF